MCGIFTIFSPSELSSKKALDGLNTLQHRGPDAEGHVFLNENHHFLGHRRLSIIDLSSNANQPFHSQSGKHVMVFNGEIYNYQELANKHVLPLKTSSDTEVVIELFEKMGAQFVHELNGMFSIVILNIADGKVSIFRDRLGIKPLYYALEKGSILFSSELPPLTSYISNLSINEDAIPQFLHLGYIPEPNTFYHNIFKFPSGCEGTYQNQKLTTKHYWKPEDQITEATHSNHDKVIKETHDLLQDSVKLRLRSDVPSGTFLSGGIDSGLISAIAASQNKEPINTFNVKFENSAFDESVFATEMAELIKSQQHTTTLSSKEVLKTFKAGNLKVGEPFADSSMFPVMAVSKFAAQHVKMILSGDGGDELFMGYGAYNWADRLSKPLISSSHNLIAAALRIKGDKRSLRAANVFDFPSKSNVNAHIFSQEQNLFSIKEIEGLLHKEIENVTDPIPYKSFKRSLDSKEQQSFFDLTHYLKDDLLVKVDRASMHYGLEVRVPFLDHRLVSYAINIDSSLKTKNGESKYILKKIMEMYYPNNLIYRKKWGFSMPLETWMKNGPIKPGIPVIKGFDNKKIEELHDNFNQSDKHGFLYNRIYALHLLKQNMDAI